MPWHVANQTARKELCALAHAARLDVFGGGLRRTSSRFCFGVEHGDYNGTELFGVGTDRFLWLAFKPNHLGRVRLASANFMNDGLVEFSAGHAPEPSRLPSNPGWGKFAMGVDWVLRRAGMSVRRGFDAVIYSNIPGGGMSRSASLCLNLLLCWADVQGTQFGNGMEVAALAQQVENDYVGSPCGILDPLMIYFARAGVGTHFHPKTQSVTHVPLGAPIHSFRLVAMDTGTVRPGLEHSTYQLRRAECAQLAEWIQIHYGVANPAELHQTGRGAVALARLRGEHPDLADRLQYLLAAHGRFPGMLTAWREGNLSALGATMRADGIGLRDLFRISGPELESMCTIARQVPGVLGERMLGGGDKGAAGAIVLPEAEAPLRQAIALEYPRLHPNQQAPCAMHACRLVDGITQLPPLLAQSHDHAAPSAGDGDLGNERAHSGLAE